MKRAISLVIPAWNAESFLGEALESALAQSDPPAEVIVVDDGSTDGTAGVARRFGDRVRLLRRANGGPAAARNSGIDAAQNETIAFLDADDIWPPGALARLSSALDDPAADVVAGRVQCETPREDRAGFENFGKPFHTVSVAAALFRRALFSRVGPFDASLRQSEDLDWFMRARQAGINIVPIFDTTLLYRLHGGNTTRDRERREAFMLQAVHRAIGRRRTSTTAGEP